MKDQPTTPTGTHPPSAEIVAKAHIDAAKYDALYARSISDPEGFWAEQAQRLDWIKAPTKIKDVDF
ncbi:acetyl-coenzyme A synthetase N-terminal domain-containing protein, partial [Thetidibacter halocola]